jgi:glycosyltransferase involved in cell wall biosynthesis
MPPGKLGHVVTVYDMIHELYPDQFPPGDRDSLWKKECCRKADRIIAISNSTKNDLVELFDVEPGKVEVIHLASSLGDLDGTTERSSGSGSSRPYILFVGLRGGYKNFAALVEAYARSRHLQADLDILCFGGGSFSDAENRLFSELGVAGSIRHLTGGDSLLAACYREAAAFVYPSLYEGFGIPPLEAMTMSCPVICSNTSSIPEVVGDAGIFFDPADVSSVQEALEETLFSESLLKELRERGHRRRKKFSWRKCADETTSLYRSMQA